MNWTLRQLRAFAAVTELKSFTAAANRLFLTQSALSLLVRDLEREVGAQLLDRRTRDIELTKAGEDLYPFVQRILNDLNSAATSVAAVRDLSKGLLRVAAPQLMSCTLMPEVIQAFRGKHPRVDVQLVDTLMRDMLEAVASGKVEIGIGPPTAGDTSGLDCIEILRDRHHVICRAGHPLAAKRSVRWKDLQKYPFIEPTHDFLATMRVESDAGIAALRLEPTQRVAYISTAMALVAASKDDSVTVCPSYAARLATAYRLKVCTLEGPPLFRSILVYTRSSRSLSPAAKAFLETMVAHVKP